MRAKGRTFERRFIQVTTGLLKELTTALESANGSVHLPCSAPQDGSLKLQSIWGGGMLKHIFLRLTPVFDSVRFNKFPCDVGRTGSGRALWGPLSYCGLPFPITQSFLIKFPFNKLQLHSNLIPRKVDLGYLDWSFGASQTFPREWITSLGLTKKWNFIYTFLRGCSVNCLITCLHGRQGSTD